MPNHYLILNDTQLKSFANGTAVTSTQNASAALGYTVAKPTVPIVSEADALTWLAAVTPPWTLVATGVTGTASGKEWILVSNF